MKITENETKTCMKSVPKKKENNRGETPTVPRERVTMATLLFPFSTSPMLMCINRLCPTKPSGMCYLLGAAITCVTATSTIDIMSNKIMRDRRSSHFFLDATLNILLKCHKGLLTYFVGLVSCSPCIFFPYWSEPRWRMCLRKKRYPLS